MGRKLGLAVAIFVGAMVVLIWWTTPAPVRFANAAVEPALPAAESRTDIIAGTEKRVTWFDESRRDRRQRAVVYIHGFSATRQETAPVAERVAQRLGANLYETRLTGHGLRENAMVDATAEDWLQDTVAAISAGAALGDRVTVIGTSTGATLTAALLDHPVMAAVDSLVFLSPNFGLQAESARHSTGPGGRLLTRLIAGETHSWTAQNEAQARYWTTSYPTSALIELVRVLDYAETKLDLPSQQRWLMLYSSDDQVVQPAAIRWVHENIDAAEKELIEVQLSADASNHILAGDIMSPDTTDTVVGHIVRFIERQAP